MGVARKFFENVMYKFTDDVRLVEDMMTIFDESTTNAIRHAYSEGKVGPVKVSLYLEEKKDGKYFILTVFDEGDIPPGMPMDMTHYKLDLNEWFKEGKVGGIGLMVISQLADKSFWKKTAKGKYFVAIKKIK